MRKNRHDRVLAHRRAVALLVLSVAFAICVLIAGSIDYEVALAEGKIYETEKIECVVTEYCENEDGSTSYILEMPDGTLHEYVVEDAPVYTVTLEGEGGWGNYTIIDL